MPVELFIDVTFKKLIAYRLAAFNAVRRLVDYFLRSVQLNFANLIEV